MFPEPTELRLIGCSIESISTPKSKSNTLTPKTQLADMLSKGNFTRYEWNHLWCLFNISHSGSTVCSEAMAKRSQQDSGEERVTAKSRPMMNFGLAKQRKDSCRAIFYCIRKPRENQTRKPVVCRDTSHEQGHYHRFVESTHSTSYSEWDDDKTWSSQEWKADKSMDDRTGQHVVIPQRGGMPQQFIIGDDETELDLSLGSRSFLDRVNDQVRKNKNDLRWMSQKTTKNIIWYGECSCLQHCKHLYSWERITWTIVIPSRIQETSHWNKCSTYLQDWCLNKMRSLEWKQLIGKINQEIFVFDWWWKSYQSSAHKGLRLFRFCIVSW